MPERVVKLNDVDQNTQLNAFQSFPLLTPSKGIRSGLLTISSYHGKIFLLFFEDTEYLVQHSVSDFSKVHGIRLYHKISN